jgi:hypothetical protein
MRSMAGELDALPAVSKTQIGNSISSSHSLIIFSKE